MKRFLTRITTLSIILIVLKYFLLEIVFPKVQIPYFLLVVLIFFLATNFVFYKLLTTATQNMRKFNARFLGMSMIKMFIYLILTLVYLWFFSEFAKQFLISLFMLYISYAGLEIYEILRIVKRKN